MKQWCVVVAVGACWDHGVDKVLGPYATEREAIEVYDAVPDDCMAEILPLESGL